MLVLGRVKPNQKSVSRNLSRWWSACWKTCWNLLSHRLSWKVSQKIPGFSRTYLVSFSKGVRKTLGVRGSKKKQHHFFGGSNNLWMISWGSHYSWMSKTIKTIKKIVAWLLSFLDLSGKNTYDNMDYQMIIFIFLTCTRRTCPFNLELKDMVFKAITPTRAAYWFCVGLVVTAIQPWLENFIKMILRVQRPLNK